MSCKRIQEMVERFKYDVCGHLKPVRPYPCQFNGERLQSKDETHKLHHVRVVVDAAFWVAIDHQCNESPEFLQEPAGTDSAEPL